MEPQTAPPELVDLHDWSLNDQEQHVINQGGTLLTPSQYLRKNVAPSRGGVHRIPYDHGTIAAALAGDLDNTSLVWRPVQPARTDVPFNKMGGPTLGRIDLSTQIPSKTWANIAALLSYSEFLVQHEGYRIMRWAREEPAECNGLKWRQAKPLEIMAALLALFLADKWPSMERYRLNHFYLLRCFTAPDERKIELEYTHEGRLLELWVLKPPKS